jgi:predicted GIY-YIG superfamily endonuclease
MYVVYHIYDKTKNYSIYTGYVGVTNNLKNRINQHKSSKKWFDENHDVLILHEFQSKDKAFVYEGLYRPLPNMGYNFHVGGEIGGFRILNQAKKEEWIKKLKQKRAGKTPALGMKHSEETKIICGEYGKLRWDGQRAEDKWPDHLFDLPFKEASKFGIPKTTYYRQRRRTGRA